MDAEFRIEAPDDALRLRATGFDTDQGSQFTSPRFTQALPDAAAKVWVDGRGRRMDDGGPDHQPDPGTGCAGRCEPWSAVPLRMEG